MLPITKPFTESHVDEAEQLVGVARQGGADRYGGAILTLEDGDALAQERALARAGLSQQQHVAILQQRSEQSPLQIRTGNDRVRIALHGVAATAGITGAGVVAVGIISLGRCGFLRDAAEPGTLSESLCREGTGWVMFLIVALAPAVAGLGGTVRAAASRNRRLLRLSLAVAATVPAGVALLYLVSGWL